MTDNILKLVTPDDSVREDVTEVIETVLNERDSITNIFVLWTDRDGSVLRSTSWDSNLKLVALLEMCKLEALN